MINLKFIFIVYGDEGDLNSWRELPLWQQEMITDHLPLSNEGGEIFYNDLPLSQRVSLSCLFYKIKRDNLENELALLGSIKKIYIGGKVDFKVREKNESALQNNLLQLGYVNTYGASFRRRWGLRSNSKGAQMHFFSYEDGVDNVHIDLFNPGGYSLYLLFEMKWVYRHLKYDYANWDKYHSDLVILSAVGGEDQCGIGPSDLYEINHTMNGTNKKFSD